MEKNTSFGLKLVNYAFIGLNEWLHYKLNLVVNGDVKLYNDFSNTKRFLCVVCLRQ